MKTRTSSVISVVITTVAAHSGRLQLNAYKSGKGILEIIREKDILTEAQI